LGSADTFLAVYAYAAPRPRRAKSIEDELLFDEGLSPLPALQDTSAEAASAGERKLSALREIRGFTRTLLIYMAFRP
jgi:hypothetical protein